MLIHDSGYKSRTFFLFNRNITALFYNVLSVGRKNVLNQRIDFRFLLYIVIVVKRADDGISLVGGILYCGGCIMFSVIGYGKGFDTWRHIGKSDISDGSFGLADRLDNGARCGHGKAARHVVFVFEYALFEKFISAGRGLAGVNHNFAVVTAYLLPIGDFPPKDVFQLLAGELLYWIGRMRYYGKGVIRHNYFGYIFSRTRCV